MKLKALRILFSLAIRGDKRKAFNRYVPLIGVAWLAGLVTAQAMGNADLVQQLRDVCSIVDVCSGIPPEVAQHSGEIAAAIAAIYGLLLRALSLARKSILPWIREAVAAAKAE